MRSCRHVYASIAMLVVCRAALSQIPNSGFESWSAGNPVNWTSTNTGFTNNITQSPVARTGSLSAKGEIVLFSGVPFPPSLTAGGITQRVSISQNHSALTCYYQFFPHVPTLTMSLYVTVSFFDAQSQQTASGSRLAPFGTTSTWQLLTIPMTYSGSGNPSTSASIQFTISGTGNPTPADMIGSYFLLDDVALSPPTSVRERSGAIPGEYSLEQNYPNPFNPSTAINFSLAVDSKVSLKVFNILGQEVSTLLSKNISAGKHKIDFNASSLNSGVYLYKLEAAGIDGSNYSSIKKMILTK